LNGTAAAIGHAPTNAGDDAQDAFEPTCFHYVFEDQARLTPDRPAVACAGDVLTYADLNARANQLASFITRNGGSGKCVALLVDRSTAMVTGLLGILKAGSAYVPLLPDAPPARIRHQLAETSASIVVTESALAGAVPPGDWTVVCLDRDGAALAGEPLSDPSRRSVPSGLAYVIYTSGSTGVPKGVAVTHDNLVNYVRFLARTVGRRTVTDAPALSFAAVSTLAADLGNTSIFPCLATGGCLHVIDSATMRDGNRFARYAEAHPLDVLKITPTHLAALMAFEQGSNVLPRRFLITGGEAASWQLLDVVRERPGLVWINHYGPTETTVGSLTFDVLSGTECRKWTATVPIGRPIANTQVYVVDERGARVPPGCEGELYIGGRGVSAGYLNRPALTRERFVVDPFWSAPRARLYRTGDRVRQLPDGTIEYRGRFDDEVKIRGFRVQPGEIEAALRRQPEIAQAAIVACEHRPGHKQLVAYVVPASTTSTDVSVWRAALAAELPPFMIPSAFVVLETLPLTANGKIDRGSLPMPADVGLLRAGRSESTRPLASDLEHRIASIWQQLLGRQHIGVDEDFFSAGGDSLLAMHLLARLERDLGQRLTHAVFIRQPSIAAMARALREKTGPGFASLVPLERRGTRPPLFCVHGGGGHCYIYRDLARRLGPEQPLWGLQGRHVDGRLPRQNSVEEMAEYYLQEIKQVAPVGPYYLAGASFGGKVAFEMAQILHRRKEVVALLAMFDTWGPGYPTFRVNPVLRSAGWLYRRVEHHVGSVMLLDAAERRRYLRAKGAKTWQEIADLVRLRLANVKGPGEVGDERQVDEGFIALASRRYRPSFYPGKVILFRSKQQPLGIVHDRTLGWAGLAGKLEIHDVIGLHAAVVAEPRVRHLVEQLRPCLERARAEHSARAQTALVTLD